MKIVEFTDAFAPIKVKSVKSLQSDLKQKQDFTC